MSALWTVVLGILAGWFTHRAVWRWQTYRDINLILRGSRMTEFIPDEIMQERAQAKNDVVWSTIVAAINSAALAVIFCS